jgi:multisubunit Na+/H+ antiporter MnhF subunit
MVLAFLLFLSIIIFFSVLYMSFARDKFTKIMVLNYISGLMILLIAALSLNFHRSFYLDIAIIYILLSFIASLAFSGYFKRDNKKHEKKE